MVEFDEHEVSQGPSVQERLLSNPEDGKDDSSEDWRAGE